LAFDGLLVHAAGQGPNGFSVFDVFESEEAVERFRSAIVLSGPYRDVDRCRATGRPFVDLGCGGCSTRHRTGLAPIRTDTSRSSGVHCWTTSRPPNRCAAAPSSSEAAGGERSASPCFSTCSRWSRALRGGAAAPDRPLRQLHQPRVGPWACPSLCHSRASPSLLRPGNTGRRRSGPDLRPGRTARDGET
jgi:hypothetical protein